MGKPRQRDLRKRALSLYLGGFAIRKALRVAGPNEKYHNTMLNMIRYQWPTLWRALENFTDILDEIEGNPRPPQFSISVGRGILGKSE